MLFYTDEDSNGTIDRKELKNCFQKLNLQLTEEEIDVLFDYCDMDGTEGNSTSSLYFCVSFIFYWILPPLLMQYFTKPDTHLILGECLLVKLLF